MHRELEPALYEIARPLVEKQTPALVAGNTSSDLLHQLGYPDIRKYDHDLRDYANIAHNAFILMQHPGITHPLERLEPNKFREKRSFPQQYYLKVEDGYNLAFEIPDAIIVARAVEKRAKWDFGYGQHLTCAALPLKHLLVPGKPGNYLDLCKLFPGDVDNTMITFTLGGWWHNNQTGEVLVSVPLRAPTKEYPYQYQYQKIKSEYDGKRLRYFYLHEKVHQYLSVNGAGDKNTDANCNAVVLKIVQYVEGIFPDDKFLTEEDFLVWAKWQKATSGGYSE